jgi:serine/threonine-protein kinase
MHSDTDLLFGLLARRLGFVAHDALLRAAAAWAADPAASLERRLLDARTLRPDQADAVRAAVASCVRSHGDPAAALRNAPVDDALQEALLRLDLPRDLAGRLASATPEERGGVVVVAPAWRDRYVFAKQIGKGGIARVVEAEDRALGRTVAIKLVPNERGSSPERFVREARITAKLDHPNIVPVYDFGEAPGKGGKPQLYIAMKRIHGMDLKELLLRVREGDEALRGKYTRSRLLSVFQDVCQGVAYAHSKGVIHRDLKPANVMIGEFGETLILDWGLSRETSEGGRDARGGGPPRRVESDLPRATRAADGEFPTRLVPDGGTTVRFDAGPSDLTDLTLQGDVLGTPAYMAPEQAAGRNDEVDERSDLYALGGILYQILTLEPPRRGPGGAGPALRPSQVPGLREPVPEELDAIVMQAMAARKSDRYATATALHDDVQRFLEGAEARDRARREAAARCAEARARLDRFKALRGEIAAAEDELKILAGRIPYSADFEAKRPIWDAQERLRRLRDERIREAEAAAAAFGTARQADPGCEPAREGECELAAERFLDAEEARDRDAMLAARERLARLGGSGVQAARLDAPGRLTIRAFEWACDCNRPAARPGLRVEVRGEATVPWRDGWPAPGERLRDDDAPVPGVSVEAPDGRPVGHRRDCPRREARGVEVRIARFVEKDKRRVAVEERALGATPIEAAVLSQGSYLCTLRGPAGDVRLPVRIDRDGHWAQDVALYGPGEAPDGFLYVPGGPFRSGGYREGGDPEHDAVSADVFVSRFHVTCRQYLEFLNDLAARGNPDQARRLQPREGDRIWWVEEATPQGPRFRLPRPDERPALAWEPEWPVLSVTWTDAVAYAAWRSARDGRFYSLPHEVEFEKGARGVDFRLFPWGDEYDASFAHTNASLPGVMSPRPVGSFPVDESPYGVRDLGGCATQWCLNTPTVPFRSQISIRGGSWSNGYGISKAAYKQGSPAMYCNWRMGMRLVWRPLNGWRQ